MRQNIQMQRKQKMPKASGKIPPAHLKFAINELTVDISSRAKSDQPGTAQLLLG